jgi:hypothetical protein
VHRNVSALGAKLEVSSTPGRGSRFVVRIPSSQMAAEQSAGKNRQTDIRQNGKGQARSGSYGHSAAARIAAQSRRQRRRLGRVYLTVVHAAECNEARAQEREPLRASLPRVGQSAR